MSESEQILTGLRCALEAVEAMHERGVTRPHVVASALFMTGLAMLEVGVRRSTIGAWLYRVADNYSAPTH